MNIYEFRKKYPQYESQSDRELTDALYNKYYKDTVDRDQFNRKFLDKEDGAFFSAIGAQNKMRAISDQISKTEEGTEEREKLAKELMFERDRMESLMTPFSENPIDFAAENVVLGMKSFLLGAAPGAAGGAVLGAAPGAAVGGFFGGLGGIAYESYNIWQAENLARDVEEGGAELTDEDIKKSKKAATLQAGIETGLSAVPIGGALAKAFGRGATKEILKEASKVALLSGSLEATAGGMNQAIQRAVIPELETFDEEGLKEIVNAAGTSFLFGAALGTTLDLSATGAANIMERSKRSDKDPIEKIDKLYDDVDLAETPEGQEEFEFKKSLREQVLKNGYSDETLEALKDYNAPRTEETAEIQSKLESVYTSNEQRLRLRRMDEKRLREIDEKIQESGIYKITPAKRVDPESIKLQKELDQMFTEPEQKTALNALNDTEIQQLYNELDEKGQLKPDLDEKRKTEIFNENYNFSKSPDIPEEFKIPRGKYLFKDSRGKGKRYHGTTKAVKELEELTSSPSNYYGQGFYTSDALDVVHGYKRGSKEGVVYEVNEKTKIKPFDMEKTLTDKEFKKYIPQDDLTSDVKDLLSEEGLDLNLRNFFDKYRETASDGLTTADEIQKTFDAITLNISENGFNALDHRGGLRTKSPEHKVRIYLNPKETVEIKKIDETENRVEQKPEVNRSENALDLQQKLEKVFTDDVQRESLRNFTEPELLKFAENLSKYKDLSLAEKSTKNKLDVFNKYAKNTIYNDLDQKLLDAIKKSALNPEPKSWENEVIDTSYVSDEDTRATEAFESVGNIQFTDKFGKPVKNFLQDLGNLTLTASGSARKNPYKAKALQFFKGIEDATETFAFRKDEKAQKLGIYRLQEKNPQMFKNIHQKIADFRQGNGFVDENGLYRYKNRNGAEVILSQEEVALAKRISDFYKTDAEDFKNLALSRLNKADPRIKNDSTAKQIMESLDEDSDLYKQLVEDYDLLQTFEGYLKKDLYVPFRRFGQFAGAKIGNGFYTVEIKKGITEVASPDTISIGNNRYIRKAELKELRKRIQEEQGIDIGEKPEILNAPARGKDGKIVEGIFFEPSLDSLIDQSDPAILAALANELEGVSTEAAEVAKRLGDRKELSRLKKMFRESRDVDGYSQDWDRVLLDSIQGRSHHLAKYLFSPAIDKLKAVSDQTTKNYIDYVQRGDVSYTPFRVASALSAFGLNFSTASLNLTTALTTGPIAMGIYTGNYASQVSKIYPKMLKYTRLMGYKEMNRKLTVDNLTKALGSKKRAEQARRNASVLFQNTTTEIKSRTIASQDKLRKGARNATDLAFVFMRNTELVSRLSMWETAMDDLEKIKATKPKEFQKIIDRASQDEKLKSALQMKGSKSEEEILASHITERAHGVYGAHGRAYYQRNAGSLLFPFTTYIANAMELYLDAQFDFKNPKRVVQALSASAAMAFAFGLQGVPVYQIFEPIWQAYEKLVKGKKYGMARNDIILAMQDQGIPDDVIEHVVNGYVGQLGNVDLSSRVGVGNPFAGAIKASMTGQADDVGYVPGVLTNVMQAPTDPQSYINNVTAIRNSVNAYEQMKGQKGYELRSGEVIIPNDKLAKTDILLQGAGYRPMRFTEELSVYLEEKRGGPGRYREWENKKVDLAFKAYKKYYETGDKKNLEKIENYWQEIVNRYQKEGHGEYITEKKAQHFWKKLNAMAANQEFGTRRSESSDREIRRGQRLRNVYDEDN